MTRSASIGLKQRRKHVLMIRVVNHQNVGERMYYIPFCAAICAASLRFLELYPRFEGPALILNKKGFMLKR
jgi:hypothetical protein